MDDHVKASEELFSAARSEFRQLSFFYFHNCPYERVWTDNRRRAASTVPTADLLRTYGADYRAIFVGDATMSPYEIAVPGGSVEHWNAEPGATWLTRMTQHWRRSAWLNPVPTGRLGLCAIAGHGPGADRGSDVSADAGWDRGNDAGFGAVGHA